MGDSVQLSVQDSGPGVPPEERERVFQRFYRMSATSPETPDGGSGLGLAIVKGIAQAHRGRVELLEAPGGGCLFRVLLPALSDS